MSSLDLKLLKSGSSGSLVEKILEQGQRLRNSMIQTVLSNDPFNKEILKNEPTIEQFESELFSRNYQSNLYDAYSDELQQQSQTPKLTECCCEICEKYEIAEQKNHCFRNVTDTMYQSKLLHSKFPKSNRNESDLKNTTTTAISVGQNQNNCYLLKYIDSLEVTVNSLKLTNLGVKKTQSILNKNTYFIEHTVPHLLLTQTKNVGIKSKVDSGQRSNSTIRFCSKKSDKNLIEFKQRTVHSIAAHCNEIDLSKLSLEFLVYYRSTKHRTSQFIGKAVFHFSTVISNEFFTSETELPVFSENAPLILGYLTVTLRFGHDRLYFGKEFIEAMSIKQNTNNFTSENIQTKFNCNQNLNDVEQTTNKDSKPTNENIPKEIQEDLTWIRNKNISLLYTLIYVSEVRVFCRPLNTYVISRGFNIGDTITSKIIYNDSNPIFNLYQSIPILLTEDFVKRLRDQFVCIEVWEKRHVVDSLIGIAKLSLYQFYVAYRNPTIAEYIFKNQNPIIGVDWWEPISNPNGTEDIGQLKVLIALGTQFQIEHLESSRNLNRSFIQNNLKPQTGHKVENLPSVIVVDELITSVDVSTQSDHLPIENLAHIVDDAHISEINKKVDVSTQSDQPQVTSICVGDVHVSDINKKVDVSTQSDIIEMDSDLKNIKTHELQSNDIIIASNQLPNTEITPNTSIPNRFTSASLDNNKSSVRNISELLSNLGKALSVDINDTKINPDLQLNNIELKKTDSNCFKAQIIIESALHLPSRKKCKSRSKSKINKHNEELLPSTYVTFKDHSEKYITTNVIEKTTSPNWNFKTNAYLPSDILFNNQKRLIFKVWRKSNNPSLQSNLQADIVMGFAALDLTVLMSGLPNLQGWFNIVDFTSKCNGQIKIIVTPLEDLSHFVEKKRPAKVKVDKNLQNPVVELNEIETTAGIVAPSDQLSRALKRKFTELDEITQRLRQRLCAVTNNDDSDVSNDDFMDEFEKDLNTECIETEPYSFENDEILSDAVETTAIVSDITKQIPDEINETESDVSSTIINDLDTHLVEEKQKIDFLLEKLSLLTSDHEHKIDSSSSFSRHISGCSVDPPAQVESSNTSDSDFVLNPRNFEKFFNAAGSSSSVSSVECTTLNHLVSGNETSTNKRQDPDGAGHFTNKI